MRTEQTGSASPRPPFTTPQQAALSSLLPPACLLSSLRWLLWRAEPISLSALHVINVKPAERRAARHGTALSRPAGGDRTRITPVWVMCRLHARVHVNSSMRKCIQDDVIVLGSSPLLISLTVLRSVISLCLHTTHVIHIIYHVLCLLWSVLHINWLTDSNILMDLWIKKIHPVITLLFFFIMDWGRR